MWNTIKKYYRNNKMELLITFCIFSNLYPYNIPTFVYYIGLALLAFKMSRNKVHLESKYAIYIVFLALVWLSSIVNMVIDLRLILFTAILVMCGPFITSLRWHLFKKKLMYNFVIGFATTVVISLIAKVKGVNNQLLRFGGESMMQYGGVDEFSGYAKFPMWNSAAAAISIILFAYLLFRNKGKSTKYQYILLFMLLASIYVCLLSASRSAFGLAVLASGLLFYWLSFNVKAIVKYAVIFGVIGILSLPFFMKGATRMMMKQEAQESTGMTSRDFLWNRRMAEFNSSPIFGVGYAVNGVGADRRIGRDESGGSWIAILAQTGVVGFAVALILWLRTFTPVKKVKYDPEYVLAYAIFCFFTVHTILEGYMFQGGWYMCVICWTCVGLLSEAQMYRKQLIALKQQGREL